MNRRVAHITISLASLLGWASLLAFLVFLFLGPVIPVNVGLEKNEILWWDAGLSLLFFIQHSVMIRKSFRGWVARLIGEEYVGAVYTIASGIALSAAIVFWQESSETIVAVRGIARWLIYLIPVAALLGFAWGIRSLRFFDAFGLRPIINRLRGKEPGPVPLVAAGPYRWVRHPLYLFMLLMIWFNPSLSTDRLLFDLLWTAWIVIGAWLEERDLVAEFGDSYRRYQRQVPMLVPYRIPQEEKAGTVG